MKYFRQKNLTAGSLLENEPEPIGTEEDMFKKKIENAKLMQKDKLGQVFSPLNKVKENALEKSKKDYESKIL